MAVGLDSDNPAALRAALAEAGSAGERLAINIRLAALYFDLPQGMRRLERLGLSSPFRAQAVRDLYRTAARVHDDAALVALGGELLETSRRPSPSVAYVTGCAAARMGDLATARRAFGVAEVELDQIRAHPKTFEKRWPSAARYAIDLFAIEQARSDIERARRLGLPNLSELLGEADFSRFSDEFSDELDRGRRNLAALLAGEAPDFANELVRIVVPRPELFCFGKPHQLPSKRSWLKLVGEVCRQARAVGGRACFVPDWLEAAAARSSRPPFIASYHTTGAAEGVIHFKEADLPNYMTVDRRGYSGWSTLADKSAADLGLDRFKEEKAAAFHRRFVEHVVGRNRSKYAQPGDDGTALPDQFVFVALQVPTDRVHALAFMGMREMLDVVCRRLDGSGTTVLVKRHPFDTDPRTTELLDEFVRRNALQVTSAGIHALIAGCQAVITINSGVGSEALAHLKPVYLFGKADYAAAAHLIRTDLEFRELTSPIRPALEESELRRFLLYYRRRYLVDTDDAVGLAAAVQTRIIAPAVSRRAAGLTTALPPPARTRRKDQRRDLHARAAKAADPVKVEP